MCSGVEGSSTVSQGADVQANNLDPVLVGVQPAKALRGRLANPHRSCRAAAGHRGRYASVPDRQAVGAELARLGPEPLADAVELVDLGSAMGVDDRPLPGLMRLPPVVHESPVAVIAGLEGADAVVLGIGGDRLLQVPARTSWMARCSQASTWRR
jgi:hypothetical protein